MQQIQYLYCIDYTWNNLIWPIWKCVYNTTNIYPRPMEYGIEIWNNFVFSSNFLIYFNKSILFCHNWLGLTSQLDVIYLLWLLTTSDKMSLWIFYTRSNAFYIQLSSNKIKSFSNNFCKWGMTCFYYIWSNTNFLCLFTNLF